MSVKKDIEIALNELNKGKSTILYTNLSEEQAKELIKKEEKRKVLEILNNKKWWNNKHGQKI